MNKKGFTLVELMVVIVIMAIVTIMVLSLIGSLTQDQIVRIRENTQVVIDEAKKLKEQNLDVKVKPEVKVSEKKEEKKTEPPPKIEEVKPLDNKPITEGLKPL
jgi:prepilin-type N-terminal cleavage/methylation domain-containing protein